MAVSSKSFYKIHDRFFLMRLDGKERRLLFDNVAIHSESGGTFALEHVISNMRSTSSFYMLLSVSSFHLQNVANLGIETFI
jgi:hypothetical protein